MKEIRWSILKNERLIKTRGISFEEIIKSDLIMVLEHHSRKNQKIMLFDYKKYVWVVPFVEENDFYFLKTIFPSRKYTRTYREQTK